MEYYKKVDKSFFRYGVTLPNKYVDTFLCGKSIAAGTQREIQIKWEGKRKVYDAALRHSRKSSGQTWYGIRWQYNQKLLFDLKKEFIQSYFAIESANFQSQQEGNYYKTILLGGNQEVLILRPVKPELVEIETFIKIETPYDNIFKRIVEENVFGWLSIPEKDYLITKSTPWYDIKDLKKHQDKNHVVYYLIDEWEKQIYIGSAKRLGDRVKVGRPEISGWSKFKYEIVHPKYHSILKLIEFHAIRVFASFFKNKGNIEFYPVSEYKLVNKNWPKRK